MFLKIHDTFETNNGVSEIYSDTFKTNNRVLEIDGDTCNDQKCLPKMGLSYGICVAEYA